MNPTNLSKQFRQGDVFIELIDEIPASAHWAEKKTGRIILAHGEPTGHHHSIEADAADWWRNGNEQFIEVKKPVDLTHQEHSPIPDRKSTRLNSSHVSE